MKKKGTKWLALALALVLGLTCLSGCSKTDADATTPAATTPAAETTAPSGGGETTPAADNGEAGDMDALIAAAQAEGSLTVYGSCEEVYVAAAAKKFQELYGIEVQYTHLATGETYTKIKEENGKPSADVWFGGTTDPYNEAVAAGLLEPYEAMNAVHLTSEKYRDPDGYWYGIYHGILGFMVNTEEMEKLNLEAPKDWDDLLNPEYKGLIAMGNPGTAGTGRLIVNTIVQMRGEEAAMEYFKELDKNIIQYTKSGGGPSKMVGPGEIVIAIGFLHDGVYQIGEGYDNIGLVVPASGTSYEIGATAIFKGCAHPNAAKLWIEFALSPDCVELGKDNASLQFLNLDNAKDPEALDAFPELKNAKLIDYDFDDAKENSSKYVEAWNNAIVADDRVKTE